MKRCDQARQLFGSYWDDEVTQAEREWLETHLAGCAGCRSRYESFVRTLETVGSLPRVEIAADLSERALAAARRATAAPDRIFVATGAPRWLPIAAAATLLIAGAAAVLPWLGSSNTQRLFAHRELPVPEPRLVATALAPEKPNAARAARRPATLADSLFDHAEDVEFILDPVTLHRGRAQGASRLPAGSQGEHAVISF